MNKTKKIPKRRNGFYYLEGGKEYVSVTTVLDVIAKPALIHWAAKTSARIALKDPTLSEKEVASGIYRQKKKAALKGSDIHKFVEKYQEGGKTTIRKDLQEYARAFDSFVEDFEPKILENEAEVYSDKYEYAGTLDMIIEDRKGNIWLLDVKTGKGIYPEYGLQLVAYKHAYEEMGNRVDKTGILHLKEDGTFALHETNEPFNIFLCAIDLWRWWRDE
jgi:hypothetical protein